MDTNPEGSAGLVNARIRIRVKSILEYGSGLRNFLDLDTVLEIPNSGPVYDYFSDIISILLNRSDSDPKEKSDKSIYSYLNL